MHNPVDISLSEWQEIMQLPIISEGWGLKEETPEEFASNGYAVKFDCNTSDLLRQIPI